MTSIQQVHFGLINPNDLRKMGFLVTRPETQEQNMPVAGGLMDYHMGTIDRNPCLTCNQKEKDCPGHIGYIELIKPCFIINMVDHIIKVLRCVCPECSALLIAPEDVKEASLDWISDEITSRAAHRFCIHGHLDDGNGSDSESEHEILGSRGCGAHRADYSKVDGLHIKGTFYDLIVATDEVVEEAEEEDLSTINKKRRSSKKKKKQFQVREMGITPEKAYMILRKISQEHARLMGFGPGPCSRPSRPPSRWCC